MRILIILQYSPVADPSVLVTCTVISINDGLLRYSSDITLCKEKLH